MSRIAGDLRQRHGDQRPDDDQNEQRDGAEEFAQADRHGVSGSRRACIGCEGRDAALYGPRAPTSGRHEPWPQHLHATMLMDNLDASANCAPIRLWLYAVAALVLAMVLVGGATRLTESGLSITEWKPVMGVVPPLSEAQWQAEFEKYQAIPQYRELNAGMSLDAFKTIYWWEWTHRLLGRVIGAVFLLPFLWFLWRGWIGRGTCAARLWLIFGLGALQGAVGWWMVASGLADRVEVSQYRLATHLVLACVIYVALIWTARRLGERPAARCRRRIRLRARRVGSSCWCWRKSISARWSPDCARATSTIPGR